MSDLVPTRTALHALAEHVLAPFRHHHTGRIGLAVVPGGVGTPWVPTPDGDRQGSVVGTDLVLADRDGERLRQPLTTLADAAAALGIEPGAPTDVYTPSTSLDPSAPLAINPAAAAELFGWFGLGDQVLVAFADAHRSDAPSDRTLWPEHFDLALSLDEVNHGFSPGDAGSDEPYAYVGPWAAPGVDDFWNASFGASRTRAALPDSATALAFLEEGHRRAQALRNP